MLYLNNLSSSYGMYIYTTLFSCVSKRARLRFGNRAKCNHWNDSKYVYETWTIDDRKRLPLDYLCHSWIERCPQYRLTGTYLKYRRTPRNSILLHRKKSWRDWSQDPPGFFLKVCVRPQMLLVLASVPSINTRNPVGLARSRVNNRLTRAKNTNHLTKKVLSQWIDQFPNSFLLVLPMQIWYLVPYRKSSESPHQTF